MTALGIAILTPSTPLSPGSVAEFAAQAPRLGAPVSVSGYSYEDKLARPRVITLGAVEDLHGLNGEAGLTRLTLAALPGDAGGPVLDGFGAVLGMLLPADTDAGPAIAAGVAFAASAAALSAALSAQGITPAPATRPPNRPPTPWPPRRAA